MESNTMTTYKDLTPAPKVDKKTLNKMVWMSTMLQASFNYERSFIVETCLQHGRHPNHFI